METENQTAASVKDALLIEGSPQKLKDAVITSEDSDKSDAVSVTADIKADGLAEKDDLLQKIEEAVKDKPELSQTSEEEIQKSTTDDFLKKIEKIENVCKEGEKSEVVSTTEEVAVEVKDKDASEPEVQSKETDESEVVSSTEVEEKPVEAPTSVTETVESATTAEVEQAVPESTEAEVAKENEAEAPEAMSVDPSESSNEDCMEVDSEEKNEVMLVEDQETTPSASGDVELKEASPEIDDCEIVELPASEQDVEIAETTPEVVDVEMKNEKPVEKLQTPETTSTSGAVATDEVHVSKEEATEPPKQPDVDVNIVPTSSTTENTESTTTKVVNKVISNLKAVESTPSSKNVTPVSTPNVVFNSTPIEKQFEISSENVSKISEAAETSHSEKHDDTNKSISKASEENTTESHIGTSSETDHTSTDGIKKYIEVVKKFNGIADTTTDEEDSSAHAKVNQSTSTFDTTSSSSSFLSSSPTDAKYEVQFLGEGINLQFVSIERVNISKPLEKSESGESSIQSSSSNGSVNSLPTFSLPPANVEVSTSTSTASQTVPQQQSKITHTFTGIEKLCDFVINEFTKIKKSLHLEEATTPKQAKRSTKQMSAVKEAQTPASARGKRGRKRSVHEDDVESTPKAKQAKKEILSTPKKEEDVSATSQAPSTPVTTADETKSSGPCVLAKWVDKKYYAGKVTAERAGNKFVVLFEDGASKVLPKDSIVFGEDDILPLQDQEVHALINEDDYEVGTVLSIEKTAEKVIYTVKTDSTTLTVSASEIYLEDDQAKAIQKIQYAKVGGDGDSHAARSSRNKRTAASPGTSEAGFSGGVGKRVTKRQKRYS